MKKILSLILSVMLIASLAFGIVAYAEPDEENIQVSDDAQSTQDESLPEGVQAEPDESMYNEDSITQYILLDFTKEDGNIEYKGIITGDDSSVEYVKQVYKYYYSQDLEETNMENQRAVIVNESSLTKDDLVNLGIGYIEETGVFGTKVTYFYIDATGSGNLEKGDNVATIRFIMPSRPSYCKNAKIVKNTVEKDIIAKENNSLTFAIYKANVMNILIFVMVLIVLILAVILIFLNKKIKKKKQEESLYEPITTYEVPGENVTETSEESEEVVAEEVEEIKEEAKEVEETKETKEESKDEE